MHFSLSMLPDKASPLQPCTASQKNALSSDCTNDYKQKESPHDFARTHALIHRCWALGLIAL